MKKFLRIFSVWMCILLAHAGYAGEFEGTYPTIIEKILYYKNDKFKVFYGGPIDRSTGGLRWMSLISFEDDAYKTRAVYEVCFVNCDMKDTKDAEILFIKVSDVNIKLKNMLSPDYPIFSNLLDGKYCSEKYIVVRQTDFSIVFYPEIFIASPSDEETDKNDRRIISEFLQTHFKTKSGYINYYNGVDKTEIDSENEHQITYKPFKIYIEFEGKPRGFNVTKKILKNDLWKLYYIISKERSSPSFIDEEGTTLVRIDSGCTSGQIYNDEACDCLDQLHEALYQVSKEWGSSLIIHIPAHDGRGFGTAPKAETEIYKRGGRGRVHTTTTLDTIAAAKLLYGSLNYDLRTYDGAAKILKQIGIYKVLLLTDNKLKVNTLQQYGIEVLRKRTGSEKDSCIQHIKSKKESVFYYKN